MGIGGSSTEGNLMTLPGKVKIVEVGPRDGLQNEKKIVPLEVKVEFIERLGEAGIGAIEAGSFVSPKWIPQMANTNDVFARVSRRPGVKYSALIPNMRGFDQALAAKVDEVAIFAAATESFSQKNINCSIAESLNRFRPVAAAAMSAGIPLRGYISCGLGCPYEGEVSVKAVANVAAILEDMGCYEISLGDTIGIGTPLKAQSMVEATLERVSLSKIAIHFHDTYGQALANILACLEIGVSVIDSSIAGLGGCPYARGASGNVATEDVIYMLQGMGIETEIDLNKLLAVGQFISEYLERPSTSKVATVFCRDRQASR